jgi:glutaminase
MPHLTDARATAHSSIYGWRRTRYTGNASGPVTSVLLITGALLLLGPLATARGPIGARDADYQTAVAQAHKRYKSDKSGKVTDTVPALASVSPDLYAVVIVRIDGKVFEAGDAATPFVLEGLAASFTAALVTEQRGTDALTGTLGAVAGTAPTPDARTPADWGSAPATALEIEGAIPTLSLVQPKGDADAKWRALLANASSFAGRPLALDDTVYQSALGSSDKLRSRIKELSGEGRLLDDPQLTGDLYLKQNAIAVTARDLAIMAATLANDGVNPLNKQRAVSPQTAKSIQSLIANAGLRGARKDWMKKAHAAAAASRSGAGILVMPGRLGIAVYSPPVDSKGISVRGQRAMRYLAQVLMIAPDPTQPQ